MIYMSRKSVYTLNMEGDSKVTDNWGKNLVLKSRRCTFERAEKFISKLYFSDINLQSR